MRILRLAPDDDMAVALEDLPAGGEADGVRLITAIPSRHKLYLLDLPPGACPRYLGMPAGRLRVAVRRGEAVTPENLASLRDEDDLPSLPQRPWRPPSLGDLPATFLGYRRPDGRVGTRNHLLVAYTVACVRTTARRAADAVRRAYSLVPEEWWVSYARSGRPAHTDRVGEPLGIDNVVVLEHESGCGTADRGDPQALLGWLAGYIHHPNVAGAVVLGLGCEKAPLSALQDTVGETWKPVRYLEHQALGSEEALLRCAIDAVKAMLPGAGRHCREPVGAGALVLGTKCGGSDGFSGITANPALGVVSDLLAAQQGTVLLPETPEMWGAEELLAARAANPEVGVRVKRLVRDYAAYAAMTGTHPAENLSLGNIREGLATIQMKALGAVQKAGGAPVAGVLEYAQRSPGPGLYLVHTPGYDLLATAALPASGATLVVFTTGLGTPLGNPVVPVIKVASNHRVARGMADIIDFDAGDVLDGGSVDAVGRRLYRYCLEVAAGRPTASERLDHRESAFWNRQVAL